MINLTLNVINDRTKETIEYEAYLDENANGEITLKDDPQLQKTNKLLDIISNGEDLYSLEVVYGERIQHVEFEFEANCIVISPDAQKRLLSNSQKNKKLNK